MNRGRHIFLLALSWLWIAVVIGYLAWGVVNYSGLYRWLAEWQVEQWGGYYRKWTAVLPGLLLCLPALLYIGWRGRLRQQAEAHSPAAQARTAGRGAKWLMLAGLLGMLIGAGAFAWSQTLPDGSEPAVPLDAAGFAGGQVPSTRVRIRGNDDPDARTQINRRGIDDRVTFYAGFRLDGEGKEAPIRLFVERNTPGPDALTTLQAFLPEQTGYLVENGMPREALDDLRARGVRIASPHWVLQTGDLAKREPFYIVAALGGFIGFVFVLVGFAGHLQARRRAWLATAIRPDGTPVEPPPPAS